jgi:hypothetical protein
MDSLLEGPEADALTLEEGSLLQCGYWHQVVVTLPKLSCPLVGGQPKLIVGILPDHIRKHHRSGVAAQLER